MMQSLTIKRLTKVMQPYLYHHIFWVLLPLPEDFQEPYKKKKKTGGKNGTFSHELNYKKPALLMVKTQRKNSSASFSSSSLGKT